MLLLRRCRTTLAPLLQPPPSPRPSPYPWYSHRQYPQQKWWRASSSSSSSFDKTEEATTTSIPQRYAFLEHLPPQFLRRSHAGNVDPSTAQRTDVRYDPRTGKPTIATTTGGIEQRPLATKPSPPQRLAIAHIRPRVVPSTTTTTTPTTTTNTRQPKKEMTTTAITIMWNDGRETEHPNIAVLERHYHAWTRNGHQEQQHDPNKNKQDQRKPWKNFTEAMVRRTKPKQKNNNSNSSNTTTATSSVALSMSFRDLMYDTNTNNNTSTGSGSGSGTGTGMQQALHVLYKYGILLVTDTPTDDEGAGIAALGGALGGGSIKTSRHTSLYTNYVMQQPNTTNNKKTTHDAEEKEEDDRVLLPQSLTDGPYRTLYGSVWSTSSSHQLEGTSIADSAYGTDGLPLHTDFTYVRDPPGLQVFTMRAPALVGGESVFADGLAIAEELRVVNPAAFHTLSTVPRTYQSLDHATGWSLHGSGPIIQLRDDDRWTIQGIRHNDLDRLPDLPPPPPSGAVVPPTNTPNTTTTADDDFYRTLDEAHNAWDELLGQDKFRLVMKLMPGDTMVVANQRCLHGRYSFRSTTDSARTVMGCYVSQDELSSRFRMEGYDC